MNDKSSETIQQYLTFSLGSETFAIDVSKAREVLDFAEVTHVPQMPDYMIGVINLRGSVVPVIDLRRRFGIKAGEKTVDTCIIVMEIEIAGEKLIIGTIADAVQEVLDLGASQIEPPPQLGNSVRTEFIRGMGNIGKNFIVILDIDRVFSAEELADIGSEQSVDLIEEEMSA